MVMLNFHESGSHTGGGGRSCSWWPPTNPECHTRALLYHGHDHLPRIPNIIQGVCYIKVMTTSHESRMPYRGLLYHCHGKLPWISNGIQGGCYVMVITTSHESWNRTGGRYIMDMMTSHESRMSYRGVVISWSWPPPMNPESNTALGVCRSWSRLPPMNFGPHTFGSWPWWPPTKPESHTGGLVDHGHDDLPRIPQVIPGTWKTTVSTYYIIIVFLVKT